MSEITKEAIDVFFPAVPFFTYTEGEDQTKEKGRIRPALILGILNAMAGLKHIDGPNKKLVMINHKSPGGLLEKIGANYKIESENMEDGRVKLVFSYKDEESEKADLNANHCDG